ncbi:MAG: branched-chain amino acid ABC transporter [Desulfobacterales bacterium]|nr:MAG: branched-chain amino acid ABC transporter [Desulfobacterales bacterium]
MDESIVFLTLLVMGIVTYIPRVLPMLLLSERKLSPWISKWLSFIPATVLAALLAPGLFLNDTGLNLSLDNIYLLAAFPTFFIAWRWKSFFGTVAAGMGFVAIVRFFMY